MNLDEIEDKFGGISRYQISVIMLSAIVVFGTSAMTQSAVFFSAVPDHRCKIPPADKALLLQANLTEENITALFIPQGESCQRYNYNLSNCFNNGAFSCGMNQSVVDKMQCDYGYVYDKTYFKSTTISEWDLVCGRTTLDAFANSVYFAGVLIGSLIIGFLMDWFGRKLTTLLSGIAFIVSGIACAFAPSYEVYIAFRVAVAMSGIPCFVAFYTYGNEMSGKKSRKAVGCYIQMVGAVSHAILPAMAYLVPDWKHLGIFISLTSLPYVIIFFFMPRTPRWLLANGKEREARKVVMRYAESRNTTLLDNDWDTTVKTEKKLLSVQAGSRKVILTAFFRRPFMRIVSLIVIFAWFTCSMVFYGLVLNVGKLSGDPYVNRVLNGVVELFGYSLYLIPIEYVGLKYSTFLSYSLAGICCLGTMAFAQAAQGEHASTMLEISRWIGLFGKLFVTSAFAITYQYTVELYPTVSRGTGMGMGSTAARVGSIIMPWTLELQKSVPWLTQTLFGCLALLSGCLALLLPETSDTQLTTTMDEAEDFYSKNMTFVSRFIRTTYSLEMNDKDSALLKGTKENDEKLQEQIMM